MFGVDDHIIVSITLVLSLAGSSALAANEILAELISPVAMRQFRAE
jgi:hypothetical protein